uniref:LEM domain-containing protein n=1 Tax=Acrobeloides nanus TaxID=290746 RepID=A0A914EN08_9BILA
MSVAPEPCLLHLLAGSSSMTALDAVKQILDNGVRQVSEYERFTGLTPLHVAAAWDNLAMCQLLIHYGAEVNALDFKSRTPVQLAFGKSRRFLKKLSNHKRPRDRQRLFRLLSYVFGKGPEKRNSSDASRRDSCFIVRRRSSPPPPYRKDEATLTSVLKKIRISKESPAHLNSQEVDDKLAHGSNESADKLNGNVLPSSISHLSSHENMGTSCSKTSIPQSNCLYPQLPVYSELDSKQNLSSDQECFVTADEGEKTADDTGRESENILPEIPAHISNLTVPELKQRLQAYGVEVGPINRGTRKLYEKKLLLLEQQSSIVRKRKIPKYSDALERLLRAEENGESIEMGISEENEIHDEFIIGSPNAREKNEAASFCYLLIDPSKIPNTQNCTFREFISAIFYVGKGKRSRPLQHLCDAAKYRQNNDER